MNKEVQSDELRVFEGFNPVGEACPVCHGRKNVETVLVPIPGTEDGSVMQARQVHKKCYDLLVEMGEDNGTDTNRNAEGVLSKE